MCQEDGDYVDSFAPVSSATAVRTLIAIAAAEDLHLHSIDLEQAFIQGCWEYLPEDTPTVYVTPPWGWEEEPGIVWEVAKPLYGHPAAARALHFTLHSFLEQKGFTKAGFEESVWIRPAGGEYADDIRLTCHIDDTLIAIKSLEVMHQFVHDILLRFDGTYDGEVFQYVGCSLTRDWEKKTIRLDQCLYSRKILRYFGVEDIGRTKSTPLKPGVRYLRPELYPVKLKRNAVRLDPAQHKRYRKILGFFSYLVQLTLPDLAFGYSELSRFAAWPCIEHLEGADHMLYYLAGTWEAGLIFGDPGPSQRHTLTAWVDSDYATCPNTRRSCTGYMLVLNNGPIAWKAKLQPCVTLSSAEAEFVAASSCGKQILAVRSLLRYLGFEQLQPTRVYEDNEACIRMSQNPVNPESAKHIDVACHKLRELHRNKVLVLSKVPTHDNIADAFTKSLPAPAFLRHRAYMVDSKVAFLKFLCFEHIRRECPRVCGA